MKRTSKLSCLILIGLSLVILPFQNVFADMGTACPEMTSHAEMADHAKSKQQIESCCQDNLCKMSTCLLQFDTLYKTQFQKFQLSYSSIKIAYEQLLPSPLPRHLFRPPKA